METLLMGTTEPEISADGISKIAHGAATLSRCILAVEEKLAELEAKDSGESSDRSPVFLAPMPLNVREREEA